MPHIRCEPTRYISRTTTRAVVSRPAAVLGLLLALPLAAVLLAGCGSSTPAQAAGSGVVRIPAGQAIFAPFVLAVRSHATVTWTNADTMPHTITTTPDRSAYLNPVALSLVVPAGKSASFTFTTPGVYDYYDPAEAVWNADEHRVAAKQGVHGYPLAMEGVIWVQGPIAGVPSTATNPIPGKDEFTSDFLAVRQGGTVAWYNADTDAHDIALVPGWGGAINPAAATPGLVDGGDAVPPNGQTKTTTYPTPGLYYYYCSLHASIDPTWHRAVALPTATERPLPMETFVLVVPS